MNRIDTSTPCVCGGEGEFKIDWDLSARNAQEDCYVECTRCGRRTKCFSMPWLAYEAWDRHEYTVGGQMTIFDVIGGEEKNHAEQRRIQSNI